VATSVSVEKRIQDLDLEFEKITQELVGMQRNASAMIRRHATILEEKFEITGQADQIYTISGILIAHYRAHGLFCAEWAASVLDLKYKDPSRMNSLTFELESNTARFSSKLLEDIPNEELMNMNRNHLQELENQSYKYRDYLLDLADIFERKQKQLEQICLIRKIAVIPKDIDHPFDSFDAKKNKPREKPFKTQSDASGKTEFSELIGKIKDKLAAWSKQFEDIQTKIIEFKPTDPKDIEYYCHGAQMFLNTIDTLMEYNKPFKDLKFSFNWLDWCITECWNQTHGKNAAAGKYSRLPGTDLHPDQERGLTREQVCDRMIPTYNHMVELINRVLQPMALFFDSLPQHRKKYVDDHIRDRKLDVGPRLVERKKF